jgi:hypothetical protein
MSSLYNYELDERHIRLVMLDSEIEVSESDWERFEASRNKNSGHKSFQSFMPSFEFSIPKNVLYPSLFVVIIFGLSAMLYSFVDFKKTKSSQHSDLTNASSVINNASLQKASQYTNHPAKNSIVQKAAPIVKADTAQKHSSSQVATIQASVPILANVTEQKTAQGKVETPQLKENEHKAKVEVVAEQKPKPKSRKKKIIYEELPSINTSSKIIETTNEPELDLK